MSPTDVYGELSSTEQAELDVICEAALDVDMSFLDFEALCRAGQSQAAGHNDDGSQDALPKAQKNDDSDSPFFCPTPTCDPGPQASPLSAPDDSQPGLSPGLEEQSFVDLFAPFSKFDSFTSSAMNIDQNDSPFASMDSNALGLIGNGFGIDESIPEISPMTLFNNPSTTTGGTGELFAPTPTSSPDHSSVVSPLVHATAQLPLLGTGLLSSSSENNNLEAPDFTSSRGTGTDTYSLVALGAKLSPSSSMGLTEQAYPSPLATPSLKRKGLPRVAICRAGARRANPTRAAASKRKSYRDANKSPMLSPALSPSASSYDSDVSSCGGDAPTYAIGQCEFGYCVWDTDCRGRRITKWECKFCHTRVGRRPDLRRHFKTCVTKEKYFCKDVFHSNGTVWYGCDMKFSRRDACYRHLKKRFTEGRCIKKRPNEDQTDSVEDFERKMNLYEDTLENYEWRAALPAAEKNRMVNTALSQIKKDMF